MGCLIRGIPVLHLQATVLEILLQGSYHSHNAWPFMHNEVLSLNFFQVFRKQSGCVDNCENLFFYLIFHPHMLHIHSKFYLFCKLSSNHLNIQHLVTNFRLKWFHNAQSLPAQEWAWQNPCENLNLKCAVPESIQAYSPPPPHRRIFVLHPSSPQEIPV